MRRIIERLETIGLGDRIWTAAVTVTCSHADAGYGALSPRSLRLWVAIKGGLSDARIADLQKAPSAGERFACPL
jgi:hypothetical protein